MDIDAGGRVREGWIGRAARFGMGNASAGSGRAGSARRCCLARSSVSADTRKAVGGTGRTRAVREERIRRAGGRTRFGMGNVVGGVRESQLGEVLLSTLLRVRGCSEKEIGGAGRTRVVREERTGRAERLVMERRRRRGRGEPAQQGCGERRAARGTSIEGLGPQTLR